MKGMQITWPDRDEAYQRLAFGVAALVMLGIVALLIFRDPVWRVLHREGLLSAARSFNGWMEVDRRLAQRLSKALPESQPGVELVEEAVVLALNRRRAEAGLGSVKIQAKLTTIARGNAIARLSYAPGEEVKAVELKFPELYLTLLHPDRLIRSIEVFQPLPIPIPSAASFADELVEGWLNRLPFRGVLTKVSDLAVGVGVVTRPKGGALIEVILVATVVQLPEPMPIVVDATQVYEVDGVNSEEPLTLYLKGPDDPGFSPIEGRGADKHHVFQITWSQGGGSYLLRGRRGDLLSDPRPVFAE